MNKDDIKTEKLSGRFEDFRRHLRDPTPAGWDNFIKDLGRSVSTLKHELANDLFVIKGIATSDIKKVQAVRTALKKIDTSKSITDLWTGSRNLDPLGLHKQLIADCEAKLKRDGHWRVDGKGDKIKNLRKKLKALDDEIAEDLWTAMPEQSATELHEQLLKDCDEWDRRKESEDAERIALTDAVIGMAINLTKTHLAIEINTGEQSIFPRFHTEIADLIFDVYAENGDYSAETPRTQLRKYFDKNDTTSTPPD